jgi:ubiquinone/menaquinone biosynthesis C-methylase UbiE
MMVRLFLRLYFWLAERLYNELAWSYDMVSWLVSLGNWDRVRRWALEYISPGERVLELGFGTGALLLALEVGGWQAVGVERSGAMQRVARRRLRQAGVQAQRVQAEAQSLPFTSGCFDALLATYPAGYILEDKTWQEARRVLKEPGDPAQASSRVVVVGLTVYPKGNNRPQSKPERIWETFQVLVTAAGFALRIERRTHGRVEIPVAIAEKRPPAH